MNYELKEKPKILVVVGPTASGKSALADEIAARVHGVIINADARQIYKGLPVLTAAETPDARHRLYQFLDLDEPFSYVQYAARATHEIETVMSAGLVPIIVGGTGLYIDALLGSVGAAPQVSAETRERVKALSADAARAVLIEQDPAAVAHIDMKNPRRVARALEVLWETGMSITTYTAPHVEKYNALIIGVNPGREKIVQNICERVLSMWQHGVVDEVRAAYASGIDMQAPGMQTIGVPEISAFLSGAITETEAQELLSTHTKQYAKRQMTWFRRKKNIVWYTGADDIWQLLRDFLRND